MIKVQKMSSFYLDAGTTWSKILEVKEDGKRTYSVLHSCDLPEEREYIKTTGHRAKGLKTRGHVNEIVALSKGSQECLGNNGVILDLGSRDAKWVKYRNGKFSDMDWNSACGSATGATVEMLLKFYDIKAEQLSQQDEKYSITCGIFAMEKIMDDISKGIPADIAISKFIHGLAFNAFKFTKEPQELLLSGGFCENKCFMDSLNKYCNALPLGRFVLVDGLLY